MKEKASNLIPRPPVVAVLGHIDHGKSTLLDYIRKTNIVDKESGGITQKISAYEVAHTTKEGKESSITFLDTPGHEAFCGIRGRGADIADIAVLIVSAEDGVKEQTLDALRCIKASAIPFLVAISKIDKPGADAERTRGSLAEHEVYVEGYGGAVPAVPISSKTGEGVPDLLDMILLMAELEELKGDIAAPGKGIIMEAERDPRKGISATLVMKEGSLKKGQFIVCGSVISPVRIMENFLGKPISEAHFGQPVRIIGWDSLPIIGKECTVHNTKKEADDAAQKNKIAESATKNKKTPEIERAVTISLVIKTDTSSSLEAIEHEIAKIKNEEVAVRIIHAGIGNISEGDIKLCLGRLKVFIVGFNVMIDPAAKSTAERMNIEVTSFDIIYKMAEWITALVSSSQPKRMVEEVIGSAKILKTFSRDKDRQIVGGRVEDGILKRGAELKIMRRETEIGTGKIRGMQQQKVKVDEANKGMEFGTEIESRIEIAPGDKIIAFTTVEK